MSQQLLDRLEDARNPSTVLAELGSGCGALLGAWRGQGAVKTWIQIDLAERALKRSAEVEEAMLATPAAAITPDPDAVSDEDEDEAMAAMFAAGRASALPSAAASKRSLEVIRVCGDAERLPLMPGSVDTIVSVLDLHWTNDVEGVLRQARQALRPDGLFLAVLLGGESAHELSTSLVAAETERRGGVSNRASPLMRVADAGALLSSAGFALPAVDTGFVQAQVSSAAAAMELMGEMGESAAPARRPGPSLGGRGSGGDVLLAAAAVMQWRHGGGAMRPAEAADGAADPRVRQPEAVAGRKSDAEIARRVGGAVPLTFQTVWMAGFAPAPTQQRPLPRGSVPHGFRTQQPGADVPAVSASVTAGSLAAAAPAAGAASVPQYPGMGGTVIDLDRETEDDTGTAGSSKRR